MLWKWNRGPSKYRYGKSLLLVRHWNRVNQLQNGIHSYILDLKTWRYKTDDKIGRTLPINFAQRPIKSWSQLLHGSFLLKRYRNWKEQGKQFLLHRKSCQKEPSRCFGKTWRLLLLGVLCRKKLWVRQKAVRHGPVKGKHSGDAQYRTNERKRVGWWWFGHLSW